MQERSVATDPMAPVEVVVHTATPISTCWPAPSKIAKQRQKSGQAPRTFRDYREMLKDKDLEIVLVVRRPLACFARAIAASSRARTFYLQKPSAPTCWKARPSWRRPEAQAGRADRHPAQKHSPSDRRQKQVVKRACWAKSATSTCAATSTCEPNGNPPVESVPAFLDYELWTGRTRPLELVPTYDGLPHRR